MARQKTVYFTIPSSQLNDMEGEEVLEVLRYDGAAPVRQVTLWRGPMHQISYWLMKVDATDKDPKALPTAERMKSFRVTHLVAGEDQHQVMDKMREVINGKILLSAIPEKELPLRV